MSASTPTPKYFYGNSNEAPRAIVFPEGTVSPSVFISNIHRYLEVPQQFSFVNMETTTDRLGMHHHRLQQYAGGVPLEGMTYRVHEKNGFITSVNGRAVRNITADLRAEISEEQAFQLAVKYAGSRDTTRHEGRRLIVSRGFAFTPESFVLAFQFDIDVSFAERWRISVDARTGALVNKTSLVQSCFDHQEPPPPYETGRGLTSYYGYQDIRVEDIGSVWRMEGQTQNGGIIETRDFQNMPMISLLFGFSTGTDFLSSDKNFFSSHAKPGATVQWGMEQSYEYYFQHHNRNSFDGFGGKIVSYVHLDENMDNAFWTGRALAFGDGSNNNPWVELDIVGHELTHGVTQYEAFLEYSLEPGALNESFSDIFGKAIEFNVFGDTATWLLANRTRPGGLRSLSNPNLKGQPDTYAGDLWYTGSADGGGVHYNSGVQNYWFYLLCEGGSGVNDHGYEYSVQSVGMEVATNIAYRNLSEYLSQFSDYLDSRIGSQLAAADLYGIGSNIYAQVDEAWDAVGVTNEPIISNLDVEDITATTAKITGSMLPRSDAATYRVEYGTTPALGLSTAEFAYAGSVETELTGLTASTRYYVRLVATNESGSSYSSVEFVTKSLAPLVQILPTVDVTNTTAKLYGRVNPNSLATSFHFEFGTTAALGSTTPEVQLSDATIYLDVSADVSGLDPRKTYFYRLIATNSSGRSEAGNQQFFTAGKPVIASINPASAPVGAEVTLTGSGFNPDVQKIRISFGATRATVISATPVEVKVVVAPGASLGPVTMIDTESGLTAESSREFVPTYTGEFGKSTLALTAGIADIPIDQALVSDMDGDGKPDIVTRHYPSFSIFQNVNQGGDLDNDSFVRYTQPSTFIGDLVLADVDANGLNDVIEVHQYGFRIYPNFSVPGYIFLGVPVDIETPYAPGAAVADFDNDGRVDFAVLRNIPGDKSTIDFYRNQNAKNTLTAEGFAMRHALELPHRTEKLYASDLNNDGRQDLIASAWDRSVVGILRSASSPGEFVFEADVFHDELSYRLPKYLLTDVNQDGWKEIVTHSYWPGTMAVLQNLGTTSPIGMADPVGLIYGIQHPSAKSGDIDGDGKVDLIAALNAGKFALLRNRGEDGAVIDQSTFELFQEYGEVNDADPTLSGMAINDLNGDGRPEVINAFSNTASWFSGYYLQIWQNAPTECLDASLIRIETSANDATIILPENTEAWQYEMWYAEAGSDNWYYVNSTTIDNLTRGQNYRFRARTWCHLAYTPFEYVDFATDCFDPGPFNVTVTGADRAMINTPDFGLLEIEYSIAGMNQWFAQPQYSFEIVGLQPGTSYDLRYRGLCPIPGEYQYVSFTTECPRIESLEVSDIHPSRAVVSWSGNYSGPVTLQYSFYDDAVDWTTADPLGILTGLHPGKSYWVRARVSCNNSDSDWIYELFSTPCPSVTALTVAMISPFDVTLIWEDSETIGNYEIVYPTPWGYNTRTFVTDKTFTLEGLNPGTEYTITVKAECLLPGTAVPITFTTVCFQPFNLQLGGIGTTTAALSWNADYPGVPFFIDYTIVGSDEWESIMVPSADFLLEGLRPGAEYEARVRIGCPNVTPPFVSTRFATEYLPATTFVPNPTDSRVTIFPASDLKGKRYTVHDSSGRLVLSGEITDYQIDFSFFAPGVYALRIEGEKVMKVVRN